MPNIIIIGQRRQGKTTLAVAVASTKSDTIIVWDPNDNVRSAAFESVRPNAHWGGSLRTLEQFMESAAADPGKIHMARVGPVEQGDIEAHFAATAEVLWGWTDYAFIVDESPLLQKPSRLDASLDRFIRRSPADVYVIQTCHRMFELHALSRYLVDEVILFRLELPRERQLIGQQFHEQLAAEVAELGDREYAKWYRDNVGRTDYYRQPNAAVWYVDLANRNARERSRDSGGTRKSTTQTHASPGEREATSGPDDDADIDDADGSAAAAAAEAVDIGGIPG